MSTKQTFEHPAPVEQRDLPSLKEVIEVDPSAGPKPLTIQEYKARTAAREQPPKKKRGGRRIKLLSARRLNIELLKTATNEEDRQRYKERLAAINQQLRGAK
ncbi:hypothetical protein RF55_24438 [Lasius niger]|uniref:Uncharacterized protein n=1 Tax=Lasius niger TaxID=67767 RepID=A0A0J7MN45_LASNI|nr:hypothetical protein RF55_24438 [Lasius niger]